MANTIKELIAAFETGKQDAVLRRLYVDESMLEGQRVRYVKALKEFERLYGEKEVEIYSAAGRSEIGGNHTDHQHGRVMAGSVNLDVIAVAAKKADKTVRIKSEGYRMMELNLEHLEADRAEEGTSAALVRGVAAGLVSRGFAIGGFEAYVTSNVLSGSGLSSSAAYETLIGNIFSGMYNEGKADSVLIAQVGQYAENVYFGKPCGLMDQMACSVGGLIQIDFEDPKKPIVRKLDVDFAGFGHSLCIVDTKGSHADLTDDYAAIPAEMKAVARYFGKEVLRQVERSDFYAAIPALRRELGDRAVLRAIHWFDENERAAKLGEVLEKGDFEGFKKLVRESADSSYKYLQNVYASHKVQSQSVSIAIAISEGILKDRGVVRVHGGGFAGTIQAFVPEEMVEEYKQGMERIFGEGSCYVLKIRNDGGLKVV